LLATHNILIYLRVFRVEITQYDLREKAENE
jgi:hypothetical protein